MRLQEDWNRRKTGTVLGTAGQQEQTTVDGLSVYSDTILF